MRTAVTYELPRRVALLGRRGGPTDFSAQQAALLDYLPSDLITTGARPPPAIVRQELVEIMQEGARHIEMSRPGHETRTPSWRQGEALQNLQAPAARLDFRRG